MKIRVNVHPIPPNGYTARTETIGHRSLEFDCCRAAAEAPTAMAAARRAASYHLGVPESRVVLCPEGNLVFTAWATASRWQTYRWRLVLAVVVAVAAAVLHYWLFRSGGAR